MKKTLNRLLAIAVIISMASCKKEETTDTQIIQPVKYSSVTDFYIKNAVPLQTFTINAISGGSFTTAQGTTVTIPPNAFETESGLPVTTMVNVEFKDIYKKSDMLLSNKPTTTAWGTLLKSGGEFFIRVISNNEALILAQGKKIDVALPYASTGAAKDTSMQAFVEADSTSNGFGGNDPNPVSWVPSPSDILIASAYQYVYSIYSLSTPAVDGNWFNADYQISSNVIGSLTMHPLNDPLSFQTDVFLNFKNQNSMMNLYLDNGNFKYSYAFQNMQCTAIAIGVKDGELYSAFVPVNMGNTSKTVNFTLTKTTTEDFKMQLIALN